MTDYYVYVYIDPRNYEEFYFGKGRGSRKDAHLQDESGSEKSLRIQAIKNLGLEPIIRVIARELSEHDALLVEKTLLWKLGRQLTNISQGHYSDKFRPHDTLHKRLSGFDFQNSLYYYNVGEETNSKKSKIRDWDDYRRFGFISGGQGIRFRDAMLGFNEGDVIAAYLKGKGFVGIGKVTSQAKPVRDVIVDDRPLVSLDLVCKNIMTNSDSLEKSEYVAMVKWIVAVDRQDAKWQRQKQLYTTTHIRASLENQPQTVEFLEEQFDVSLKEYLL